MDVQAQTADIRHVVHDLDKRVSVLETRINNQAVEMKNMRGDIKATKDAVCSLHTDLREHMQQEVKDRQQVLVWIIVTLFGVLTSIALPLLLRGIG